MGRTSCEAIASPSPAPLVSRSPTDVFERGAQIEKPGLTGVADPEHLPGILGQEEKRPIVFVQHVVEDVQLREVRRVGEDQRFGLPLPQDVSEEPAAFPTVTGDHGRDAAPGSGPKQLSHGDGEVRANGLGEELVSDHLVGRVSKRC